MLVKNKAISIGCGKGFIDKTPKFMKERQRIMDLIDLVYKKHGAEKLETPVFELKEVFSNKKNVCSKLLDLDDQGGEILALRYDLKHPLIRYLSMNKIEKHMKVSQSGYVYRNEVVNPEKFRFREFFVSDFDICGPTDAMMSEVQCIRMCCDIIKTLELEEPVRLVIGHKKITESLLRIAGSISDSQAVKLINKISDDTIKSAINWDSIEKQISDNKISANTIKTFHDMIQLLNGNLDHSINLIIAHEQLNAFKEAKPVISELIELNKFCKMFLNKFDYERLQLDFNLLGPRSYFSGLVFSAKFETNDMVLLSGGRYDNLILKNSKTKMGCTGFSIGVDQLVMHKFVREGNLEEISTGLPSEIEEMGDITTEMKKIKLADKKDDENILKNVKGTMDRSPQQMEIREKVFNTIISCFKRHNADTIDTPVVEKHDVLTGKYGEDSKLIYDLNDVDNEKLSLRYDLTVPFARYLAMRPSVVDNKLFKRYQIGRVYRRDNPSMSRGRYREFYQCDFDIAGNSSQLMQPDYECLNIVYEILRDLKLGDYKIKVNHRKFLDGLLEVCGVPNTLFRTICSSIDKLDKTPWTLVYEEMLEKGLPNSVATKIGEYVGFSGGVELINQLENDTLLMANASVQTALSELRVLFSYCSNIMDKIRFDLSLARGLDYYTGMIFEAVFSDFESKQDVEEQLSVGSVSGGGRYDNLVNMFSQSNTIIPCVGLSIGVERLMSVYEKTQFANDSERSIKPVMVITAQKNMVEERLKLLSMLLDAGITATHSMKKNPKALDVFQECERMKIPLAVIIGEDELKENSVKLRYIDSRIEELVPRNELIDRLKSELVL